MDPIALSVFSSRIAAVCDEMGAQLRRAAFSPNIRDRLDYSCAVFDAEGELAAQAAHIPVHLGSMAHAMTGIVGEIDWSPGDMVVVNDPYRGGTHLPDVTLIAPLFVDGERVAFVANRAHHADIGAEAPGSMPLSTRLDQEGLVIPPTHLLRGGDAVREAWALLTRNARNPRESAGDFRAQVSANRRGLERLAALVGERGREAFAEGLAALNDYAETLTRETLAAIPAGRYAFTDFLDDDGQGNHDLAIRVTIVVDGGGIDVDFTGTAGQTAGNVNCPLAVAAAAVFYAFRCLLPDETPACAGSLRPIRLHAPAGCLVNARPPAAVAAGNVETSSRVVDAVLGALHPALPERIPAASHGGMNNVAMGSNGSPAWDYYETMGGGMGAAPGCAGLSGVQTHMTNTLNTPVEVLESHYPLRVGRYALRRGSGGAGRWPGGDGLVREYHFLRPTDVTVLTERRRHAPWGLAGGADGQPGANRLDGEPLPPKTAFRAHAGQVLTIETPGGGGFGNEERD